VRQHVLGHHRCQRGCILLPLGETRRPGVDRHPRPLGLQPWHPAEDDGISPQVEDASIAAVRAHGEHVGVILIPALRLSPVIANDMAAVRRPAGEQGMGTQRGQHHLRLHRLDIQHLKVEALLRLAALPREEGDLAPIARPDRRHHLDLRPGA